MLTERISREGFHLPILQEETLRRAAPLCLDDEDLTMFWDHLRSLGQGIVKQVPPVFLAGLRDARLLNNGVTIRSFDNTLFWDPFHDAELVYLTVRPFILPPVDLKLPGEYIHFASLWGLGHYHWVLEVLPRLLFLERFDRLRGMPLIVQHGVTQTQRESLQMLGIRPERIIEFNGSHWQVEHLYYIQPGLCANPTPLHAQWLRERFAPHSTTCSRRLYVSREDATVRRVVNEGKVVEELLPYGFEVVALGGMSFADQVQLFNEAEIIVGPHGAGFTNAVFAQPGATLIELFSPSYINGCFWALANACGHRYGFTVGTQCGDDIEVDICKFLRLFISMSADAAGR